MSDEYNIWQMYGLNANPFNPDPLLIFGGDLPIKESFFGREKEFKELKRIIYSNKTSRILIYGDIGIGKTTFVNYIRHTSIEDGYFTPFGELGIQYNWTPEDFMFSTIDSIYSAINMIEGIKVKFDKDLKQKLDVIFGFERGKNIGGGISILGIGGDANTGQSYGVPRLNANSLKLLFQKVVNEVCRIGYKGVILHYNNLELLQDKEENQLKKIMNGIRDFLQIEGVHFIFVSDKKMFEMFQQIPRVEDIFKVPIQLNPFDLEEIKKIINIRIEILSEEGVTPLVPFEDEALSILFKLYSGNLRGILRSLDCSISQTIKSRPVKISSDILKFSLFNFAQGRFLKDLSPTDKKVLFRILEKKETTNKLLAEHFKILPQNISTSIGKLREVGAVRLSRSEGRSKYYVPSQEALWLLLTPSSEL